MTISSQLGSVVRGAAGVGLSAFIVFACGGTSETGTGSSCTSAPDCYQGVTGLKGVVSCLTQVPNGYCTHACSSDSDCCSAANECSDAHAHPEVCAPLENNGATNCFLSCENSVLMGMDGDTYCQQFANPAFGCRSTGGGSANRKVCLP
jgi:hypothetical protein